VERVGQAAGEVVQPAGDRQPVESRDQSSGKVSLS
jgi:hypothetical protein